MLRRKATRKRARKTSILRRSLKGEGLCYVFVMCVSGRERPCEGEEGAKKDVDDAKERVRVLLVERRPRVQSRTRIHLYIIVNLGQCATSSRIVHDPGIFIF